MNDVSKNDHAFDEESVVAEARGRAEAANSAFSFLKKHFEISFHSRQKGAGSPGFLFTKNNSGTPDI